MGYSPRVAKSWTRLSDFTSLHFKETNSCEKKRGKRQRRKGKIYQFEYRVPKIPRRDKKAFLNDQCKEIEENNRMEKTRDLFKKIRATEEHSMQRWAQ